MQARKRGRIAITTGPQQEPDEVASTPETSASDTDSSPEGKETHIAVYDIVWQVNGGKMKRGFFGSTIEIKEIKANHSGGWLFNYAKPRYKAYFHYELYEAVFSCELTSNGECFTNFNLLRRNTKMKAEFQKDSLSFFFQDDLVDDNGRILLGFRMSDWATKHMNAISGWAKLRIVPNPALSYAEAERIEENEKPQIEFQD